MQPGGLTDRYVKALAGLDLKGSSLLQLQNQLNRFTELYNESADLRNLLENPAFSVADRKAVVEDICRRLGVTKVGQATLFLLCDKGRIGLLPEVTRGLESYNDAQAGVVRAEVTSANPMNPVQTKALTDALSKIKGKPVKVTTKINSGLIGGAVVEMEGVVFDGSIRRRLADISERIPKEIE